jgi:hypothetical protein
MILCPLACYFGKPHVRYAIGCSVGTIRPDVRDLRRAIEALPLPTFTYVAAVNRVEAIDQYLRINERGALKWELNLLIRILNEV